MGKDQQGAARGLHSHGIPLACRLGLAQKFRMAQQRRNDFFEGIENG